MSLNTDGARPRGNSMTQSDATSPPDDVRREPLLRIVSSNEFLPVSTGGTRQSWQSSPGRPHPMSIKQDAMVDRALQARIGGMLRDVFSDLADAPVPDRFFTLLEALDAKEKSGE